MLPPSLPIRPPIKKPRYCQHANNREFRRAAPMKRRDWKGSSARSRSAKRCARAPLRGPWQPEAASDRRAASAALRHRADERAARGCGGWEVLPLYDYTGRGDWVELAMELARLRGPELVK